MAAAIGLGRFAYTPLLPDMVAAYGWGFAQAGDVASANYLGYMVGALAAPFIGQSANVRLWVAVSLMASVATTAYGAQTDSYWGWLLLRFAAGVASAYCVVLVTTHLIHNLADTGSADRLGNVHFAGVGIGILACLIVISPETDLHQHWGNLGAAAAVLMAVAWFCIADLRWNVAADTRLQYSQPAGEPALWRIVLGYGLFGYGYVVSATFVVAMAAQISGQHSTSENAVWWCVGAALVPSVYLWQWLANRFGLIRTLCVAYLVEVMGTVVAGLSGSFAWLMFACVLLGGTFAAITALGISAARAAAPHRVAFAVSGMTAAFALGQLIGPAASGRIADYFGNFVVASLVAAGLLLVAALLLVSRNTESR